MKIRTMIAAAMSMALLTVFVAAPVSAGGPVSYKVGLRGVEYGIGVFATNCPTNPKFVANVLAPAKAQLKAASASKLARLSMSKVVGPAQISPCGDFNPQVGQSYYVLMADTAGTVFGQAGSGYEFTGLGVMPPVTALLIEAWVWNGAGWTPWSGFGWLPASALYISEDLAGRLAVTEVPVLGTLSVACLTLGYPWLRDVWTNTGGVSPNDGWTYDYNERGRMCNPALTAITMNGTPLSLIVLPDGTPQGAIYRTVVTAVDVYPY
jgi:hypothetical protein